MEYQSAAAAAERLGVTVRAVQKWAKSGKLAGAFKAGRDWMIPVTEEQGSTSSACPLFVLFDVCCPSGALSQAVQEFSDEGARVAAQWELLYARGRFSDCLRVAEPYLDCGEESLRLSAIMHCAFSALGSGDVNTALQAIDRLRAALSQVHSRGGEDVVCAQTYLAMRLLTLQLSLEEEQTEYSQRNLRSLRASERAMACFVFALSAHHKQEYARSLGIAQAALTLIREDYLLPMIYLHIIAAANLINLRESERASAYLERAWELAEKDGLIMPFAENYTLLLGLLERTLKRAHPKGYKAIVNAAKAYQTGWLGLYNRTNSKKFVEVLTPVELTVALLYHRNWRTKEIAEHLHLSERTVANHIQTIYGKIGARGRRALGTLLRR